MKTICAPSAEGLAGGAGVLSGCSPCSCADLQKTSLCFVKNCRFLLGNDSKHIVYQVSFLIFLLGTWDSAYLPSGAAVPGIPTQAPGCPISPVSTALPAFPELASLPGNTSVPLSHVCECLQLQVLYLLSV